MENKTTLSLVGDIQAEMLSCFEGLDISQLETLKVNSLGGSIDIALQIGDALAPYRPHIIIDEQCNSSCANYWLPLARKITFGEKALVVVHGSLDTGLIADKEGAGDYDIAALKARAVRQEAYRQRHKIPKGWLQYRTDYSKHMDGYAPWLLGELSLPRFTFGKVTVKSLVVTEPMLRTCLLNIELVDYDRSWAGQAGWKDWRWLMKQGAFSSGTLVCPAETVER